jgi:hypothetical protein
LVSVYQYSSSPRINFCFIVSLFWLFSVHFTDFYPDLCYFFLYTYLGSCLFLFF